MTRRVPHDVDAEASVISAVLLRRDALDRVLEILKPEHFYAEVNGEILAAAIGLRRAGIEVSVATVGARVCRHDVARYLAEVARECDGGDPGLVVHVELEARLIFDLWRLRRLIATCQRIAAEGYRARVLRDVGEFIADADRAVASVAAGQVSDDDAEAYGRDLLTRAPR